MGGGAAAGSRGSTNTEEILERAKVFEETGSYSRAIDSYLLITEKMFTGKDKLVEIWENAVRLALKHSPGERYPSVCEEVARRLVSIYVVRINYMLCTGVLWNSWELQGGAVV